MKPLNFSNFLGNKHSTTLSEKTEFIHSDTLVRVEENCPGFRIATRYPSPMKISRHPSDKLFGNRKQSEDSRRMWSREVYDVELDMVYYNYRHYNPSDGRWIGRDSIQEKGGRNLYKSFNNNPIKTFDLLGNIAWMAILPCLKGAAAGGVVVDVVVQECQCCYKQEAKLLQTGSENSHANSK